MSAVSPGSPPSLRRLHPLTPLVRGWRLVVGLLVVAVPQVGQGAASGDTPLGPWALGLLAVVPVAAVVGWLVWRTTSFGVERGDLRVDSGVLTRRSRRVRLDRLQSVDVVQPFLARVLGLAELRLEVAGGTKAEAPLAYLGLEEARALRAELLARAAGLHEDTPEAPEQVLHVVPNGRLLAATLRSPSFLVGAVLVPVGVAVATVYGGPGALIALLPGLFAFGQATGRQFMANYDFTLAASPDGLRVRRGLLETRAQTIPPGRVQAVRLAEPAFWRLGGPWRTDWVRVEVDVAAYERRNADERGQTLLLPVAPRPEALRLLAAVLPRAQVTGVPLHPAPARARWMHPLSWPVLGVGADAGHVVARRGWLRRETDAMPLERVQSLRAVQGPLQRLLGLATVHLDTSPGPVTVRAEARDQAEALGLVLELTERARAARAAALPDQWMAPPTRPEDAGTDGRGARYGGAVPVLPPDPGPRPLP